jgi:hypothetical protein
VPQQGLDCEVVGQRSFSLAHSHVLVAANLFVSPQVALRLFAGTACLLSLPPCSIAWAMLMQPRLLC